MTSPAHPVAFVLSGCCDLVASHIGMLRALSDHLIEPDVVIGSSIGALVGAAYAEHPTLAGLARLEHLWTTTGAAEPQAGASRLRTGNAAAGGAPPNEGDDTIGRLARRVLRASRFDQLIVPFHCAARDTTAGTDRWFDSGPLLPAVLASTAPREPSHATGSQALYPKGALTDDLPLRRAVALGARTIYVLDESGTPDHRSGSSHPIFGPHRLARHGRLLRELDLLPSDVEALVMPAGPPPTPLDGSPDTLVEAAFKASQTLLGAVSTKD